MKLSELARAEMINYILQHGKKKSAWEIAKNTGYGVSTIQQNANKLGVTLKSGDRVLPKRQQILDRVAWIKENGAVMTINELAAHFNVTYNCIKKTVDTYELDFKQDYPGRSHPHSTLPPTLKKRKEEWFNADKMMAY